MKPIADEQGNFADDAKIVMDVAQKVHETLNSFRKEEGPTPKQRDETRDKLVSLFHEIKEAARQVKTPEAVASLVYYATSVRATLTGFLETEDDMKAVAPIMDEIYAEFLGDYREAPSFALAQGFAAISTLLLMMYTLKRMDIDSEKLLGLMRKMVLELLSHTMEAYLWLQYNFDLTRTNDFENTGGDIPNA